MFYHATAPASGYNPASMSRLHFVTIAIVIAVAPALAAPAFAGLDPASAERDVSAARAAGSVEFCASPSRPLTSRARKLCPHAKEIPSCAGFAAACAEAETGGAARTTPTAAPTPKSSTPSVAAGLGAIAQVIVWLLVAAIVGVVLMLVARALLRMRRDVALADPTPKSAAITVQPDAIAEASRSDAEVLLARADLHARRGELDAALFTYLAAALRALDQRGAIRLSRDRTNGEYVRACKEKPARAPLRDIVGDVDRVQFGGEAASNGAVSRAAERAAALVRALPTMIVALAIALATSACAGGGGGAPSLKGEDPAGSDLFVALLKKQGVSVTRAGSSLATLPMPTGAEAALTVVVDTDRISLDDETSAHLLRWVEAGGSLVLAGRPESWPKELGATTNTATGDHVTVWEEDDDGPRSERVGVAPPPRTAIVASSVAFSWGDVPLAWFAKGETYAAMRRIGKGIVLGVATDELLTNAALARPGNAAAIVAILDVLDPHELRLARSEDAIAPPSNPVSGMIRAGLGLGLAHALVLAAVLFLAVGIRLARPKPTPPPARRAFAESVEASGALYARAGMASHALAAYARFVDERLRARMPRRRDTPPGVAHATTDVAAFLAARSGADAATCERVWQRAKNTRPGDPPRGDELDLLKQLTALYAAATNT